MRRIMRLSLPGHSVTISLLVLLFLNAPGVGLGQELSFHFEVELGGAHSAVHAFGLRPDALTGLDEFDIPTPPAVPDAPFTVHLAMSEPPAGLPNQWLEDYRPTVNLINDRVELWEMDLTAAAVGGTCSVSITEAQPAQTPYKLNFFGPGADFQEISVPGTIDFPISSPNLVYFWELRLSDEVDVVNASWGGVKSLYR